jgi:hypothetical protein
VTALPVVAEGSKVNPRDKTARRLLGSSAKNSYAPALDIDWDLPPRAPGALGLPPFAPVRAAISSR